jgi:PncC family amidohydrolase
LENQVPANEEALIPLSRQVGEALLRCGAMAALAESCTGGLVGHLLTEIPGSSSWFAGSAGVYSYEAKERILGVDRETLLREGAVCAAVAQQMAQGALRCYGVDVAVAVTGIAGPGGGTPEKPTGLVHFHLSAADGFEQALQVVWSADRRGNKLLSARTALQMLLAYAENRGEKNGR